MSCDSGFAVLIDNEALRAIDIRLANEALSAVDTSLTDGMAQETRQRFANAVLIGMEDGTGVINIESNGSSRFVPIARGRVDWLGEGKLTARHGLGKFGRALLVEVRNLPFVEGVIRTFGDRMLIERDDVLVYEEYIGPGQTRLMHNHGPRLVLCLTELHTKNTLPGNEKTEVKREKGTVIFNAKAVTHEITNAGAVPFWCVLVEHP